jgi:benzoate membrane transport protein
MLSPLLAGLTAAIVGFGGSVAVVLAAATAARATPAETASWIAGLAIAIAISSGILSWRHRIPIVTAWSTPGAALIAATSGLDMPTAVGAFIVAAVLIVLTALIAPLGRLVERLPMPVASAMLAGVLLKIVIGPFESVATLPWLILPLILLFLGLRRLAPQFAVIGVLMMGIAAAAVAGLLGTLPALALAQPVFILPRFDPAVALGLGVPLYLVTMASQNLAGFAVLRASGYQRVPTTPILAVTGALSLLTAPLGAHTSNLAAISAAVCTGRDCHPDPAQRWPAGIAYMACYVVFAVFAPWLVGLFAALPIEILKTMAGLALVGAMAGALATAFQDRNDTFTPGLVFAVTASGVTLFGVGSAFWGLLAGLLAGMPALSGTPKP